VYDLILKINDEETKKKLFLVIELQLFTIKKLKIIQNTNKKAFLLKESFSSVARPFRVLQHTTLLYFI